MRVKDSSGSHGPLSSSGRGPFSSSIFFFIKFHLDIKLLCFFLECLIFLFSLPNFFFIRLICFGLEVGVGSCFIGGSIKVSLPLLGFSFYGLKVVGLTGCGSLSSSCLSNSGCFGLSGLNLTEGGGGGGLVGLGGLVLRAGEGLGAVIGGGLVCG